MLAPVAWRTPPRHYGPWERVTSLLTEELVKAGHDVTLFATGDSETEARLSAVVAKGYEEDTTVDPKVVECLHIAHCFEKASEFDIIHNQFDFLPLSYSKLVKTPVITTIHGFSSKKILSVYKAYNSTNRYVSISNADRNPDLDYIATIYHGIDIDNFTFNDNRDNDYLLFFGRIHRDKGAAEAIAIAQRAKRKLIMAGIIQDETYFNNAVKPALEKGSVEFIGSVGPKERNTLLGNAYALLHPINFNEPFGLSVIESMACGTPVIAFRKGSMPEIIIHGENGFLADTVDEAVGYLDAIGTIDRMACRRTVEQRFTKDIMAKAYVTAYASIVGNQ
jgi:glycosyltransferase involved in cell wall biosynthesis